MLLQGETGDSIIRDKSSKTRLEANRKILDILKSQVESNPDYRFGQLLYNIGVATHCLDSHQEVSYGKIDGVELDQKKLIPIYRDIFFEESTDTLKKLIDEISGNG